MIVVGPVVEDRQRLADGSTLRFPGGNATVFAATIAGLGVPARVLAEIGSDAAGDSIVTLLERHGVDTSWIARTSEPTKRASLDVAGDGSWIATHGASSSRAYLPSSLPTGVHAFFSSHSSSGRDSRRLHVAGLNSLLRSDVDRLMALLDSCDRSFAPVSFGLNRFDAGQERVVRDLATRADVIFCNAEELSFFLGLDVVDRAGVVAALRDAKPGDLGRGHWVVTCGADGAVAQRDGRCVERPAVPVADVRSTVGAGDRLSAAYLAAMIDGRGPEECLGAGSQAAAETLGSLRWDRA